MGLLITNGRGEHENVDEDLTMALTLDIDPMEGFHIDLNYVTGNEQSDATKALVDEEGDETAVVPLVGIRSVSIIDASVSYVINDMFNVALNYISNTVDDIGSTSLAAYVNAKYNFFDFGLRYEQFNFDLTQRGETMTGTPL